MNRDTNDQLLIIDALNASNWDRELFEEARSGGVSCVNATTAIWEDARTTIDNIGRWYRMFDENSDVVMPVRSGIDIDAAKRQGKIGFILGFQNTSPFEDDLALVSIFHQLGVRIVQLTYNIQNLVGGSCYEPTDSGLTRFGHNVISEMNRLGMIIDLSHVGERTTLDAIETSARPVAITHSNPLSFHKHPRNKSDKVLAALADTGGVLGCSPYTHIIGNAEVTVEEFCDMIARTVDLMGIDHVGIGTDSSRKLSNDFLRWVREGRWTHTPNWGAGSAKEGHSWAPWPAWFQSPKDFPNITNGLSKRGFSKAEIAKIAGENWRRLFTDGFKPA
jgi:membrane dipeptidase